MSEDYSNLEIIVRGVEDNGSMTEPIRAKICRFYLNILTGRPEIKFTVIGGTLEEFKAAWRTAKGYEGWVAISDE